MKIRPLIDLQGAGGVLAHGTFDGYHIGHLRYFKEAAKLGPLIVTVTAGYYVRNRDPGRPLFTDEERLEIIAECECVKHVALVHEETAMSSILIVKPAIYCKGAETRREGNAALDAEISAVKIAGGKTVFIPKLLPYSSGKLLSGELLRERANAAR